MFRSATLTVLLALASPGCDLETRNACDELCENLVRTCYFAAFPNKDSCLQGCLNDAVEGAQVLTLNACVQDAGCDLFTVMRCDLVFGEEG